MKLNYDVSKEDVKLTYRYCKLQKLIQEFDESEKEIAIVELDPEDHTKNYVLSARNNLMRAAKRLGKLNIKAVKRKENVYLIRIEN